MCSEQGLYLEAYEVEDEVTMASVRLGELTEDINQRWRVMAQYEDEDEEFRPSFALGMHKMDKELYNEYTTKRTVRPYNDNDDLVFDEVDIKDVEWKRPDEIVSNPKFVKEGISKFDINQGGVGNCWAMCAIANLASTIKTHPYIMEQIFDHSQSFEDGNHMFTFKFFKNGEWREVTVDDYLPVHPMSKKLLFCSSKDSEEFWPCLLEKAYAKFKGSYADLNFGWMSVAFNDMTGDEWKEIGDFHDMYYDVADYITSHGLVLAATKGQGEEDFGSIGIYSGHAYSITGFGGDVLQGKCVRLRNPWGSGEYLGSEANILNDKEDGEFVLKWNTFCQYFSYLTVKNSV